MRGKKKTPQKKGLLLHRSLAENLSRKEICSEFSHFLLSHHEQITAGFENCCCDKSSARSFPKAESPHPSTGISLLGFNKTFPGLCSAPAFFTHSICSALALKLLFAVTCSQRRPYPMELRGNGNISFPSSLSCPAATCTHQTSQGSLGRGTAISQLFMW